MAAKAPAGQQYKQTATGAYKLVPVAGAAKPVSPPTVVGTPAVHPAAAAASHAGGQVGVEPVKPFVAPKPGVGMVAPNTPAPTAAPRPAATAPVPAGMVRTTQKQANGTFKIVDLPRSHFTPAQLRTLLANGMNNGVGYEAAPTRVGYEPAPRPGGAAPAAPAPTAADPAPTATPTAGAAAPTVPSWIPPMIGFGGLTTDPMTGRIDWKSIIDQIGGVSAADATYASDLSTALMNAMQGVAAPSAEISSLTAVNKETGKTLAQSLAAAQLQKYGQLQSSMMGNAAARGIDNSGMVNQSAAQNLAANDEANQGIQQQYGDGRLKQLTDAITQQLAVQDQAARTAYYNSMARAYGTLPTYAVPAGG